MPCTYNPEPLADFFDLFYIGEGETSYDALLDLYKEWKKGDASREAFLHQAAKIPGIYVPSLYEVSYKEDGTISLYEPVYDDIPKKIEKQVVTELTAMRLSGQTGRTVFESDTGPRGIRDTAWLYPRLSFLSGGNDLPSAP